MRITYDLGGLRWESFIRFYLFWSYQKCKHSQIQLQKYLDCVKTITKPYINTFWIRINLL